MKLLNCSLNSRPILQPSHTGRAAIDTQKTQVISELTKGISQAQGCPRTAEPSGFALNATPYGQLLDAVVGFKDQEASYRSMSSGEHNVLPREHLLHLLWQQQRFLRLPLATLDRRVVTVYRPGRWSRGTGPDFLEAKLRFDDGPIQVGAVEVHVLASDWTRHGHDRDAAYASVVLHVIWRKDEGRHPVVNIHGDPIPQLELSAFLKVPLVEFQEAFDEELWRGGENAAPTPCQRSLQDLAPEMIGRLLDMAGEERWRQKANRFALKVDRRGLEQALYESILEALGFTGNRMPFWQLARLAPVERLRQALVHQRATPLHLQAILFGVAGFLSHWQANLKGTTPEGCSYINSLLALWEPVSSLFPEQLDERHWRTVGIRPANFPQRRIAAAGHLLLGLTQGSLMDLFLAPLRALSAEAPRTVLQRCHRELGHTLQVVGEADFWRHRYTINGPWHDRGIDLLGSGRATTMVVDVLLPVAAALARLGHEAISLAAVRALFLVHPRLPSNDLTREMMRQFFGADRRRAAVVDSACRQQALIQLYRDFCLNEQETCQECAFPRLLARLERQPTDVLPTVP